MKMIIDDNYQITSDPLQYMLQERKIVEKDNSYNPGKEYWKTIGYYGRIQSAFRKYKKLRIRNSDVTTLDEVLELIKKLDCKIDTLLET